MQQPEDSFYKERADKRLATFPQGWDLVARHYVFNRKIKKQLRYVKIHRLYCSSKIKKPNHHDDITPL